MKPAQLRERNLEREFIFVASRSGGPGGQNVNKVNTRIELRFNVFISSELSDSEKLILQEKLGNRISKEGILSIVSQSERSQLGNRKRAIERFHGLLSKALTRETPRVATKPSSKSRRERLDEKHKRAALKKSRGDSGISED